MGTRFAGFLITLGTSCALAMLHFYSPDFPQSPGGALGQLIGDASIAVFGVLGGTLLLLALWLAGVSLFTGVSWLLIMDRTGHWVLEGIDRLRVFAIMLKDLVKERAGARRAQVQRQEVVRAHRKKEKRRQAPRIKPGEAEPSARDRLRGSLSGSNPKRSMYSMV